MVEHISHKRSKSARYVHSKKDSELSRRRYNSLGVERKNFALKSHVNENEVERVRNFITVKNKVINAGDTYRSNSESSNQIEENNIIVENEKNISVYIHGSVGVGKSSLIGQFLTSEYLVLSESISDENVYSVIVVLNENRFRIEFHKIDNIKSAELSFEESLDACLVVYSISDKASFKNAQEILFKLGKVSRQKHAVILVGNKSDLVRSREVQFEEGKKLAIKNGCKFIETSANINYNIDKLLVGIIRQVLLYEDKKSIHSNEVNLKDDKSLLHRSSVSKIMSIVSKVVKNNDLSSKSCQNLNI